MAYLLALLETVPGQVTLEVFARKGGMPVSAMREEILVNAPLAAYFVQTVKTAVREVPA